MNGFFNIVINGKDFSDRILQFDYESSTERDNTLNLRVKPEFAMEVIDDVDVNVGQEITFFFGYPGGQVSRTLKAELAEPEILYEDSGIIFTLRATDKGNKLKKAAQQVIWEGVTASYIAKQIANKWKLKADIEQSSKIYEIYPQTGASDLQLMKKLAQLETPGTWIFYVDSDTLHFKKRPVFKKSSLLIEYRASNVRGIHIRFNQASEDGSSSEIEAVGFDSLNKKPSSKTGDSNDDQMGDYNYYDADANLIDPGSEPPNTPKSKKIIPVPIDIDEELQATADSIKSKATQNVMMATIRMDGVPTFMATDILTLNRVGRKYEGNWNAKSVRHTIDQSGDYMMTIESGKNSTKVPMNTSSQETEGQKNDSIADGEEGGKKKMIYFDANGNRI